MIYRVNFEHINEGNQGYYYTTRKDDALKIIADYKRQFGKGCTEGTNFDTFPTPKKLNEWIRLLNEVASHYDNG